MSMSQGTRKQLMVKGTIEQKQNENLSILAKSLSKYGLEYPVIAADRIFIRQAFHFE